MIPMRDIRHRGVILRSRYYPGGLNADNMQLIENRVILPLHCRAMEKKSQFSLHLK